MHRTALIAAAALIAVLAATAPSVADPATEHLIAFEKGGSSGPSTIWIAGTNGGNPSKLGNGSLPMVSPDGHTVAALNYVDPNKVILYSSAGGASRTVTLKTFAVLLAWSPDSRYLAAQVEGSGDSGAGDRLLELDRQR